MTMRRLMAISMVVAVAFCAMAVTAEAQGPVRKPLRYSQRYSPRRPTLSPYLNYFRRDVGVLDNYNTFVAPQQRLQSRLRGQQAWLYQQQQDLRNVQTQMGRYRPSGASITGTHATFMNFSHFFSTRR